MSDLFQGQTMTYRASFQYDAGGAITLTLPFKADKVQLWNYTSFGDVGAEPTSVWFRGMPGGDALQWQVIEDDGTTGGQNMVLETTNGFTEADIEAQVTAYRANISAITQANPGVITTSAAHGYSTGQIVRITDLGNVGSNAAARGMDQLNNNRYKVVVLSSTTFSLQDVLTGEDIDTTSYTAYVSGGRVVLETRVIGDPEAYAYNAPVYRLTLGSSIFGGASDNDVFYLEAIKYGQIEDLGYLANLR